jgi:phosphoglycerate dehydrogenase-like enzyme
MKIAIQPFSNPAFDQAVISAGGAISPLAPDVDSLVWTDYAQPQLLRQTLDQNPQLKWVQLPFAGVDAFADVISRPFMFTSAKGAYSEPVAEHALALCLALGRALRRRIEARTWGDKFAVSLYESKVLIVGNGGIAEELTRLLEPFGCPVVRLGSSEIGRLNQELGEADFVVLACALTESTRRLIGREQLNLMKRTAYLVNIARGAVVDTAALVDALNDEIIAGAALDVTDPEPLPDGHALWVAKNVIITPHTADTDNQVIRMFAERIRENVEARISGKPLVGLVSAELGY